MTRYEKNNKVFVLGISLFICSFMCSVSYAKGYDIAIADSLYDIYFSSDSDSNDIDILVRLVVFMEQNNIKYYKNSTSEAYLQLANQKTKDSVEIDKLASLLNNSGVIFRNDGNYISALKLHNWAKEISNRISNNNLQSVIYNNIGVVYRRLDDYETALKNHIKALKLAEESDNLKSQAVAINSIGNIQMMIGNLDESLEYFKQSLILEQKQNSLLGMAINLNNIGSVYDQKHDYVKSLEYYFLSLDINKEINSKKGIAICYNDIGNIYELTDEFVKALSYYLDALEINLQLHDKYNLANSYIQIGELYNYFKQYDKALEYLLPGLKIAKEIGVKTFLMDAYRALYVNSRAKKEYEDAFDFLQLSNKYHDSILNINVRKDIARLQIRFESERKENQIALLEKGAEISEIDIARQKTLNWMILGAFIISLGFVVSLLFFLTSKNKTNKLLIERNKIIEKTKVELDSYSKQLLKAKHEAEQNSKAKGEFLANMSHEIRTPLNSIIGFAELLSKLTTDTQQINYLSIIKSSSRTLLTILNDILDLSKIEAGKFIIDYTNTNIEEIIDDVIQMFSYRAIEKNVKLVANISHDFYQTVYFSELRLRQILFNLIGNAINFTENGTVTIKAYTQHLANEGTLTLFISVTDTGVGIHNDELLSIFEPFNQSKTNKTNKGTGLGLAITKRLVTMMGGEISIQSIVGKGSTFSLEFTNLKKVKDIPEKSRVKASVRPSRFVRPLFFLKDNSLCEILNLDGIRASLENTTDNLKDAKNTIIDKNIVIICGLSLEETTNIFNVLRTSYTNGKVYFVVIADNKPPNLLDSNLIWVSSTISKRELTTTFNKIFNQIAFDESSSIYFSDLIFGRLNREAVEDITNIYNNYFELALKTKMLNNISAFINEFKKMAVKHNLTGIIDYCAELDNQMAHFEVANIDVLLNLFKTNYLLKDE